MKITIQGTTIITADSSISMQETAIITVDETRCEYVWEEITSAIFNVVNGELRRHKKDVKSV